MRKKIFVVLLCLISCCLFACSPVKLSTTLLQSGVVKCNLEVEIDGFSPSTQNTIYDYVSHYGDQLYRNYKNNLFSLFGQKYNFETLGLNTEEKKLHFLEVNEDKYIAGIPEITPFLQAKQNGKIEYVVDFASIYSYVLYFCPQAVLYNEEVNNVVIDSENYKCGIDVPIQAVDRVNENELFVYKTIQTCAPFTYNLQEPVLLENYNGHLTGTTLLEAIRLDISEISAEDVSLLYSFTTPYERLHSVGATVKQTASGVTHTWHLDDLASTIQVFRQTANQTTWYLVALGVSIIGAIVALIVLTIIKEVKKKKGMATLIKIDQFEREQELKGKNNEQ